MCSSERCRTTTRCSVWAYKKHADDSISKQKQLNYQISAEAATGIPSCASNKGVLFLNLSFKWRTLKEQAAEVYFVE